MSEATIRTNYVPRDIVYAWELLPAEREEFDYLDWDAIERGEGYNDQFFRYKGEVYDLGEFERSNVAGWDGQQTDTFFSATLVRYVDDYERVVVGRIYS